MRVQAPNLQGLIAPAFTPMRADGSLDLPVVDRLAELVVAHRLGGVFVGGTTGEGLSLSAPERHQLLEQWVAAARGRFPVIAHVGHAGVADAGLLAAHAQQAGADAVAAVPPFYFKPADVAQVVECCAHVAAAAPALPFYYYHIPSLTGVCVSMRELMEVAAVRIPTFAGLKFSDSDLADFGRCVSFAQGRFRLFFGRDEMLLAALAVGATGAIGTTYNLFPPLYHRMIAATKRADLAAAAALQDRSRELIAVTDRNGGLPAMKAAMAFAGVDCGPCRPPLRTLDGQQREALRADLEKLGFFELTRPGESEGP
jgi:N-acetylneuraminate lyase